MENRRGLENLFFDSFREAQTAFRATATKHGWTLAQFDHPEPGPNGGPLACDVATKGNVDAKFGVLTVSGTHGIEGAAGSPCQLVWLEEELPDDLVVVHSHAINPHGHAWRRRVDHENIDVNRNFIDFAADLPNNPSYEELADSLAPDIWDDISDQISRIAWREFIGRNGEDAFAQAIMRGQYQFPDGLYFGGMAPSWSHRTFNAIIEEYCSNFESLAIIDLHSGLGRHGQADLICRHGEQSDGMGRARRWFGEAVHGPVALAGVPSEVSGALRIAPERWLPNCEVTALAVEFGTYPADKVFDAIRADNWLHHHGDHSSPRGQAIKASMSELFCPNDPTWRQQIIRQARDIYRRAQNGVAG